MPSTFETETQYENGLLQALNTRYCDLLFFGQRDYSGCCSFWMPGNLPLFDPAEEGSDPAADFNRMTN